RGNAIRICTHSTTSRATSRELHRPTRRGKGHSLAHHRHHPISAQHPHGKRRRCRLRKLHQTRRRTHQAEHRHRRSVAQRLRHHRRPTGRQILHRNIGNQRSARAECV